MTVLGLDLGTSGVKALLIGEDQRILGQATASLAVSRPYDGWSEQDPADWIAASSAAIQTLSQSHGLRNVRALGLSGQMHGATLLDRFGAVIRPAMLWNDTRAASEAAAQDGTPAFRLHTGNIVFPGFTAPKLAWVQAHEPRAFEQVATVLLPKDYLRFWLTGERISDMSDAAGTAWLDVAARDWSDELLGLCGLDRTQMPALVEGSAVGGTLRAEIAGKLGLPAGIPVAGGAGDNAATACGLGAIGAGAFASLGTSGVLFASTPTYRPNAASAVHTFCHAVPKTWHQMGVILAAADSLNWLARLTNQEAAALTADLNEVRAPGRALFLPYLSGERTPHNDAAIRGQLLGVALDDGPEEVTRAVLEGVAFAFRDCLGAMAAAGTTLDAVTAAGGGARSGYWLDVLATVLGLPVQVPAAGDYGAAFGAARLGLCALTGADPTEICTPPATERTHTPLAALKPAFDAQYARYRDAYPRLKGLMP